MCAHETSTDRSDKIGPKFSVVIPVYNSEKTIFQPLRSLYNI